MKIDEQVAVLMQGTEYGDEQLKQAMTDELRDRLELAEKEGRPLRVYCGYDPTAPDLHLGHTITMRKLRQFQEFDHDVTFLIGNFTSRIGDPSDQNRLRPQLTKEQAAEFARTFAEQAFKILDPERTEVKYNATWLQKLTFEDVIKLASNFTVGQFLARENFRLRWKENDAIFLHEFFYSLMQGYDAYTLRADVQVGGTDQLFNIVTAARKLMAFLGEKPNIAIIMGILPGTDGVIRMSKSMGNHIPIDSPPEDMYGKVMSIPDVAMPKFFQLITRWTPQEILAIESEIKEGSLHPRDAKMKLAREIVDIFHGKDAASKAEEHFINVFQKRESPEEIASYVLKPDQTLLEILTDSALVKSKSEARRLIDQKGVRLEGETLSDPNSVIDKKGVLQVGKRRFLKLE